MPAQGTVGAMGFSIRGIVHTLGAFARKAEQTVTAKVQTTPREVKDGFERVALVGGDAVVRSIQNHLHAPTVGKPNPSAGVGRPPVILLAGQGDDAKQAMQVFSNSLKRDGFKVFVFDDPGHALESHADASAKLDKLVEQVRAQSGGQKVDLVGYSTGGTNARAYVNLYGGAAKVDRVVQLAGTNNGDPAALDFAASGVEEKKGSAFMRDLNANPATVPIYSIYEKGTDGAVVEDDAKLAPDPLHHNQPMPQAQKGGGGFIAWSDHVRLPYDERAYEQVLAALTK